MFATRNAAASALGAAIAFAVSLPVASAQLSENATSVSHLQNQYRIVPNSHPESGFPTTSPITFEALLDMDFLP